jgi:ribose transport system substrate-binding protein
MAYYGTKLLDDLHHHPPSPLAGDWSRNIFSPIPRFVDTGTFVVDKTNVDALAKAPAPASAQ